MSRSRTMRQVWIMCYRNPYSFAAPRFYSRANPLLLVDDIREARQFGTRARCIALKRAFSLPRWAQPRAVPASVLP